MTLSDWQLLFPDAAAALRQVFHESTDDTGAVSEAATSKQVERLSGTHRQRMWRNNSGAATDERTGRLIRYGVGNTSARINAVFKSSDYIGITTIIVQPHHVGQRLGIFTALEMKKPGWHLTPGDKRGQAQANYLAACVAAGGIGEFITHPQQYVELLQKWGAI